MSPTNGSRSTDSTPPTNVMALLESRLAYLGLTADDRHRLSMAADVFHAYVDRFVDDFYQHLFAFEQTARFLKDPALVARLKVSQQEHLKSMLSSPWDEAYCERRRRVGQTHADVGIEPEMFLGGYNLYVQFFFRRFSESIGPLGAEEVETLLTVLKTVFLDLGLTLDAYFTQSTHSLRHALDMLLKANLELKHFAHLASHDLKTPLATVANLCDEALDEFGTQMPAGARELIEAARKRTFRMSEMIDDLLSSIVADHEDLPAPILVADALAAAVERLTPILHQRGIAITVPATKSRVLGSRVRLQEALYNLLSNAAKFIDKHPGRITVTSEDRGDECVICVADNGPGIPREEVDRIFAPFRRLSMHRELPGSGLGLYFTKALVEHQGGRVWVESEPGSGSRFYISLHSAAERP